MAASPARPSAESSETARACDQSRSTISRRETPATYPSRRAGAAAAAAYPCQALEHHSNGVVEFRLSAPKISGHLGEAVWTTCSGTFTTDSTISSRRAPSRDWTPTSTPSVAAVAVEAAAVEASAVAAVVVAGAVASVWAINREAQNSPPMYPRRTSAGNRTQPTRSRAPERRLRVVLRWQGRESGRALGRGRSRRPQGACRWRAFVEWCYTFVSFAAVGEAVQLELFSCCDGVESANEARAVQ